jgi:TonB family protein
MALTLIPLNDPSAAKVDSRPELDQPLLPFDHSDLPRPLPVYMPVLLGQLQDDLSRSRLREAFWISVVAHLLIIMAMAFGPKYWPHRVIAVKSAADLLRERQATFLELPPDEQQVTQRPNSKFLSDKDRIASSRTPRIDRKTLEELRNARRPGPPQPPGAPSQPAAPAIAQATPQQQQPGPSGPPRQTPPETAELRTPPVDPKQAFGGAMSPGSAIEQAARAAAGSRGYGGAGGDYGNSFPTGGGIKSNMDILSDTMGVDFGPYLARVLHDVRQNWYQLIPEIARAPLMKKGRVAIEFAIMKDGSVAGMRLIGPSGDVSLDRAAWGGITGSNPFPPLPNEFHGQYLALRFRFFYNPDKHDLE